MLYTCPCCGYKTLPRPAGGTYALCNACWWEDDQVQFENPDFRGGANGPSLREAQYTFARLGASDIGFIASVADRTRLEMDPDFKPLPPFDVPAIRERIPALARRIYERPAVFFDGPAGSQTPQRVIDAIADYLAHRNANHGGVFATSIESDRMLDAAHEVAATFVGSDDPGTIAFGANMTTLTFALSRALARTWRAGDDVIVTRLDHDANVTPWVLAAEDAGATARHVEIRREDCTLDLDDFRAKLSPKTRLVAVGCASNAVGTINPVAEITRLAHDAGALVFLDAVHYAPHALIDVAAWGCDFLACSAYKFFGPHVGLLWGRRELLEAITPYKLRPAPDDLPGRWMTGTQNHECIAGVLEAIEYLADLGRGLLGEGFSRRERLAAAYDGIVRYERELTLRLLAGLAELPQIKVHGVTDPARIAERMPTIAFTHERLTPEAVSRRLAERGIFTWHGNYYALPLTEALGLEPNGMVRVGLLHYNTEEEVDRLLDEVSKLD
ncbi:MAG: cysteine desulfurase-like protein [Planctomycetota bacterium]|nr:MAG: cysteine desulfurase-like protein [Planctomycetota bacterium]